MADTDATIADLRARIQALELDRDYWRNQHDLVMQDWRADIEAWSGARADLTASRAALADLLRFFDGATGAVAMRQGQDFLNDAFARAHLITAKAVTPASGR